VAALNLYEKKRNFGSTPEPDATPAKSDGQKKLIFVVQRHDASRLHYDFRLEADGVLKSWAVPKGPSLNPADKRLAMMVEDHPITYATFEGEIPEGNYGAGTVEIWDSGTYTPLGDEPVSKQIEKGNLKVSLNGKKLRGEFALVRIKGKDKSGDPWLLIKHNDEYADPDAPTAADQDVDRPHVPKSKRRLSSPASRTVGASRPKGKDPFPTGVTPMLAQPAETIPKYGNWLYEIKWDGVRALCSVRNGKVDYESRNALTLTRQFPELAALPKHLRASDALLDGEIVMLDDEGRSDFQALQPRIMARMLHEKNPEKEWSKGRAATLALFDLLYVDGEDIRKRPLSYRKQRLQQLLKADATFRFSSHVEGDGEALLEVAKEKRLEGIVAKATASVYESRRSSSWLKIKIVQEQDCVICGYIGGKREAFGSLILGIYDNGKLIYAGNVGTGFSEREGARLRKLMDPFITKKAPFADPPRLPAANPVHWLKPKLVCRIKYSEWTSDGKLRAPVYLGLRDDVKPTDCVREEKAATQSMPDTKTVKDPPKNSPVEKEPRTEKPPRTKKPEPENNPQPQTEPTPTDLLALVTHPEKIYFPEDGITKGDVARYYYDVADVILPHLKDRPLSLKRYPGGINTKPFFQKHVRAGIPESMVAKGEDGEEYIVCNTREDLVVLANLGCIDQNPWMSRIGSLDSPDYILVDLDPFECAFTKVIEAAIEVRKILEKCGLRAFPKTTGGDGLHIFIPLNGNYTYDDARMFAEVLSLTAAQQKPALFTTGRAIASRQKDRVYFDYLQIGHGKTIASAYSLRAYPHAPVSMPLDWKELTPKLTPTTFTIKNARERIAKRGDCFADVLTLKQSLTKPLAVLRKMYEAGKA